MQQKCNAENGHSKKTVTGEAPFTKQISDYVGTPRASIPVLLGLGWEQAAPALPPRSHPLHIDIRRQLHLLAHVTSTWSARAE